MDNPKTGRLLDNKLRAYSAAAGVTLLGAAPAVQAQVTDVSPDLTCPSADVRCIGGTAFEIDFDGDADGEFLMDTAGGIPVLFEAGDGGSDVGRKICCSSAGFAGGLNSGAYVTTSFGGYNPTTETMLIQNGAFGVDDMDKYAVVTFTLDGAANTPGNVNIGWIQVSVAAANASYTLYAYAYNSAPGAGITTGQTTGLPVELTNFDAVVDGNTVGLTWETATETNNAGFEIHMRPFGDDTFQKLFFVSGHGTTLEAQSYSHQVKDLAPGRYTFRLKQVDFNGASEFSSEIETVIEVPGTHMLDNAYPNPFNPVTNIRLAVATTQQVRLEVFDVQGQQVAVLHDGLVSANEQRTFQFDGQGLPSGMYIYRATGETFTESKRVQLVK